MEHFPFSIAFRHSRVIIRFEGEPENFGQILIFLFGFFSPNPSSAKRGWNYYFSSFLVTTITIIISIQRDEKKIIFYRSYGTRQLEK